MTFCRYRKVADVSGKTAAAAGHEANEAAPAAVAASPSFEDIHR